MGLVKLRERSSEGEESETELMATGTNAEPRITAVPSPYDKDLLMRQMVASARAASP